MKNYIYKRYCQAEQIINDEINSCIKYRRAKNIDFKTIRENCMKPLQIKTMPDRYKDQISSILCFCFKREVSNKYLYPVLFEGKLYSKLDAMSEECRKMVMNDTDHGCNCRPYPVLTWHFTEGMDEEK